ncbi:centrosomal protein 43 [Plutella xylostella]|uniref:centrosomal protein 43 n=1 Tax=Plutella xylostella TaxID=51655 RepID=UPI002032B85D|nr:centrosomal protein 43 [Plutella xylostella]
MMAQTEDTELRDLVMEALEKNGSLAKIRALLRANVFLAFEEDSEIIKHNISLDNILKVPEGILTLSLVHEFLEFCELKNTLFVYMSETRQGKEYSYEGQKQLADKLHGFNYDETKEPILLSIVKNISKVYQRKCYDHGDGTVVHRDDQNSTYIVHEDSSCNNSSSSQSNSQSDQSSDEKNKLHLQLPLDNSDTDTSSDSAREKTRSEYIPNDHIVIHDEGEDHTDNSKKHLLKINESNNTNMGHSKLSGIQSNLLNVSTLRLKYNDNYPLKTEETSIAANNSDESTSYVDVNPYDHVSDSINTSGIPDKPSEVLPVEKDKGSVSENEIKNSPQQDSISLATSSNVTSLSSKHISYTTMMKKFMDESNKSATNTPEYTCDFSSSPPTNDKQSDLEPNLKSPGSTVVEEGEMVSPNINKHSRVDSPHQNSQSSQSSVSISDVADLIELSEANSPMMYKISEQNRSKELTSSVSNSLHNRNEFVSKANSHHKLPSDDSGDFSESSVPSLSNLSLDIHSD